MKTEELVVTIYKSLPYSEQITDLDFSEEGAIRFTWRSVRFRVSKAMDVETVQGEQGAILASDDISMIFETLLKKTYAYMESRQ